MAYEMGVPICFTNKRVPTATYDYDFAQQEQHAAASDDQSRIVHTGGRQRTDLSVVALHLRSVKRSRIAM